MCRTRVREPCVMGSDRMQGAVKGFVVSLDDGCLTGGRRSRRRLGVGVLCLVGSLALLFAGCPSSEPDTVIMIDSTPESGATLFIAGGIEKTTPAMIAGLPPGPVDILLKRENYRDAEDTIQVVAGGPPQSFVIEMEPLVGYLTVTSSPPGADVYLNGEEHIGQTPLKKYPVPIGEYTYDVRLADYYPYSSEALEVVVDRQYGTNTTIRLKPQEATLLVTSKPTGAGIWINGALQAEKTPHEFTLLPARYIVDVHTDGHIMTGERVELLPNGSHRLALEMKAGDVPVGMVLIPAGPFIMGSKRAPDEQPESVQTLPDFYIDKYEVTNAEFKDVYSKHEFPDGWENYPVTNVSWTQAVDFAGKVGKRLPTEAEWEKAARGSEGFEFPWGNNFDPTLCNVLLSGTDGPAERGDYIEGLSPYGCVDMAGNVYEWTQDWYQAYEGNMVVTRDYGQVFRVLRGGSFRSERFDVRSSRRHYDRLSAAHKDYGFRCALDGER